MQPLALAAAASGMSSRMLCWKRAKLRFRFDIESGTRHEDHAVLAPKNPGANDLIGVEARYRLALLHANWP